MKWGFDTKNIDKAVRPQDDFYRYANGAWLKKSKIPQSESRWGSFTILRYTTEHQLKKLVASTKNPLVRGVFASAMDMKRRNALGTKPLDPIMKDLWAVKSKEDLLRLLAHLHVMGISGFFGSMVDQDAKQSTAYRLHLWQGGLGMPDRDYYIKSEPEQVRVRKSYVDHIYRLLGLAGYSGKDALAAQKIIMDIETKLATASMRKEDTRDAEKVYHNMSVRALQKSTSAINWGDYLKLTHAKVNEVIVGQPDFFIALSNIIAQTPLEDLKTYLGWHIVNDSASLLGEKFVKENFSFYGTVLTGTKKMREPWRRALGAVQGTVGFELGRVYVERHFPPAAKRAMDTLVSDLFAVYEGRIKELDWMSVPTKRKAVIKLRAMKRKIGYPTKWKTYKGLVIKPTDYFGNMMRSSIYEHMREMKKLGKKVDRSEWFMSPQTVNAYCNFGLNEIVFPAAILQWPFFDLKADAAVNYAGIGSVIGHEMTHGFDDQGAKFDAEGNMKRWWKDVDFKKFNKKAEILKKQYDGFVAAPGVNVNGQLTLGENIADLGGLAIAYDAYQRHLKKAGRKTIDGLSSEERFFLGFAQMERELARPEFVKMQALTDPHSPAPFRINGPVANFGPFYQFFKIGKKDKLYRKPEQRAEIW